MSIIAFIAARGGSKSIPLKNIKPFCGFPLIYWNLKSLSSLKKIDKIYVATDSAKIGDVVQSLNLERVEVYDRDPENARDGSTTESVVLEFLHKKNMPDTTCFILAQITCPLYNSEDFDNALNMYSSGDFDSILSCARLKRFFWSDEGVPINYDYTNRPLRQQFKGTLMENGAFYINSVGNIKKAQNRLSGKIGVYEMPEYTAIDIDEEDDWISAEKVMKTHILNGT